MTGSRCSRWSRSPRAPCSCRRSATSGRCSRSGSACWTLGDILWSVAYAGNPPFPSRRRRVLSRLLPADLPGARAARPPPDLALQRERLARRARRVPHRRRGRRRGAARGRLRVERGEALGRGGQPRLPARRHRPPRARRRRLRDCELAAREGVGADRRRARALGARRRRLPVRVRSRVVHVGDDSRRALACGAAPARVRRLELARRGAPTGGSRAGRSAPRRRSAGSSRSACSSTATSSTGTRPA